MSRSVKILSLFLGILMICASAATASASNAQSVYPFEETLSFTIFTSVYSQLAQEKSPVEEELDKLLNTDINYVKVPDTNYDEKLTALLASGDLPEVIIGGSRDMLVSQGAVIPLDDHLDDMPYMTDFLDKYSEDNDINIYAYLRYSIDGKLYGLPEINGTKVAYSMSIRQDWLDKLGLDMPKTLDDWKSVLTAFRDSEINGEGKQVIPFSGYLGWVYGAFGIKNNSARGDNLSHTNTYFTVVDDEYIPIFEHPRYPEALQYLADLYSENLIDQQYLVTNQSETNMAELWNNGTSGSGFGYSQHDVQFATQALQQVDPDAKMVGAPVPTGPYGDQLMPARRPIWTSMYITPAAEQKGILTQILQYCDWGYSEEGSRLFSFGVEGVSYEMVDGKPVYIDPYGVGWVDKRAFGIDNYGCYYLDPDSYRQSLMGGVASVDEMAMDSALNYHALYDNESFLYIVPPTFSTPTSVDLGLTINAKLDAIVDQVIMGALTIDEFYVEYEQIKQEGFAQIADEMAAAYQLVTAE